MKRAVRPVAAFLVAWGLTLTLNWLAVAWLRGTDFETIAFYENCALLLTLLLPSFIAGVIAGWVGGAQGLNLCAAAFCLFVVCGLFHPFWHIPMVSSGSAHNGLLHYFLYNPLVALAFGSLGGWLGSQFSTGRFVLADREPVSMPGLED